MAATLVAPIEVPKPPKKEIEIINVLAEKVTGRVKWYSPVKRYGFISRNDDGGDLFVHRSVITAFSKRFPSLRNGEEVEFSVVQTTQGVEATYVTGPGGQPVKGVGSPRSPDYIGRSKGNREQIRADQNSDSKLEANTDPTISDEVKAVQTDATEASKLPATTRQRRGQNRNRRPPTEPILVESIEKNDELSTDINQTVQRRFRRFYRNPPRNSYYPKTEEENLNSVVKLNNILLGLHNNNTRLYRGRGNSASNIRLPRGQNRNNNRSTEVKQTGHQSNTDENILEHTTKFRQPQVGETVESKENSSNISNGVDSPKKVTNDGVAE